jgi:hypothetical protein
VNHLNISIISGLFLGLLTTDSEVLFMTVYLPLNGSGGLNFDNGLNVHLQVHLEALLGQQEAFRAPREKIH